MLRKCRWKYQRSPFMLVLFMGSFFFSVAEAQGAAQQYQYANACYDCHGTATTDPGNPPNDFRPLDTAFRNITTGSFKGNHRTHMAQTTDKGVCEKCHTGSGSYTTGHMNDRTDMSANLNTSPVAATYSKAASPIYFNWTSNQSIMGTCANVNCHFQATTPAWGTSSFTYTDNATNDCDQCHGAPPSGGGTGTAGSHAKHDPYFKGAAQCKKCHSDHVAEAARFAHATSAGNAGRVISVRLHDPADVAGGSYSGAGTNFLPSQSGAQSFGNCSSTYCHSDGKGNYSTPTWGTASSGACGTCHGARNDAPPSPATPHQTHVGTAKGYLIACAKCHNRTVKNTADSTTYANISSYNFHVNKAKNVYFSALNPSGAWDEANCGTTYCHSNAGPYLGTNTPVTQAWSGTLDCAGCHNKAGDTIAGAKAWSAPHTKHINTYSTNANMTCNACHAQTASGNATVSNKANHVDGAKTVAWNNFANSAAPAYNLGTHQCQNVYCHGNGTTATPTVTVTWSGTLNCNGCHGGNAATPPASATHAKHVASTSPYRFSCAKCHSRTAKDTADSTSFANISSYSFHVSKTKDVWFNSYNPSATWNGTNCSTAYCHSLGNTNVLAGNLPGVYSGSLYASPAWSGTLSCNSCHGRSTAGGMPDYTNAGGAGSATANSHGKHVVGSSISCGECHEKTTKTGTTIRNAFPGYHVNKTTSDVFFNLSGNSKNGTYNSGAKTCSVTYCHGTGPSVVWGGSTNCATCHDATKTALAGRHDVHYNSTATFWNMTGNNSHSGSGYAYGCKNCHPTNAHAGGPANSNRDANIAVSSPSRITAYTENGVTATDPRGYRYTPSGTCVTVCHSRDGAGAAAVTAVNWGTAATGGCGICHNKVGDGAPVWSAPHTKHINTYSTNSEFTCNACHAGTAAGNSALLATAAARNQHPNGVKNILFNTSFVSPNSGATYPDTATGCSNTYCHSAGTSYTAPTHGAITWSGSMTCSSCHTGGTASGPTYANGSPKANSHNRHVVIWEYTCNNCHNNTTSNGTTITGAANHVNKVYSLQAGGGVSFTVAVQGNPTTPSQCSAISCHGGNSATWGSTVNCQDCHTGAADVDVFSTPFSKTSNVAIVKTAEWTSTGHGRNSAYTSGNPAAGFGAETKQCEFCHDPAVNHNAATNVFRLKNYSTPEWGRNGPCMVCHGTGSAGVTVGSTTKNGTRKVSSYHYGANHGSSNNGGLFCWDCHDGHGDVNDFMIHDQVAKISNRATSAPTTLVAVTFTLSSPPSPVWGDYVKTPGNNGICQGCHTDGTLAHFRNNLYDAAHNPGTRCTACHSHSGSNRPDAFKPSGNCDLCHGYPPVRRNLSAGTVFRQNNYSGARFEDYTGGGGAHTIEKHIPATAKASEGWANCTVCHNKDEANHTMQTPVVPSKITIDVKDRRKFDYLRQLGPERYTGTLTDKSGGSNTNATGSCSNTSCHFKPSKKWSNER